MANMCSAHRGHAKDCKLCNTHPRDALKNNGEKMFPDWDEKVREAEEAGEVTCEKCSFKYYLTTDICPACSHPYGEKNATETDKTD